MKAIHTMLFRPSTSLLSSFVALVFALPVMAKPPLGAVAASPPASSTSSADVVLSYGDIVRTLGKTHGEAKKTSLALVGRSVQLKLIAPGPDSLVVKKGDGVFFECVSRPKTFVGGQITAKITAFELTPDGDSSFMLDRCGGKTP